MSTRRAAYLTRYSKLPPRMLFPPASLPWGMLCDPLPDGFNALIFDCDGTLVETLAAHVQAFQDVLRVYGMDVSTEWCRSKYGEPNLHVLATYEREIEEVQHGKPAPDLFPEAARRLGVHRRDCVVFEDSEEGLEGARRAGMRTVRVQHTDSHRGAGLRQLD